MGLRNYSDFKKPLIAYYDTAIGHLDSSRSANPHTTTIKQELVKAKLQVEQAQGLRGMAEILSGIENEKARDYLLSQVGLRYEWILAEQKPTGVTDDQWSIILELKGTLNNIEKQKLAGSLIHVGGIFLVSMAAVSFLPPHLALVAGPLTALGFGLSDIYESQQKYQRTLALEAADGVSGDFDLNNQRAFDLALRNRNAAIKHTVVSMFVAGLSTYGAGRIAGLGLVPVKRVLIDRFLNTVESGLETALDERTWWGGNKAAAQKILLSAAVGLGFSQLGDSLGRGLKKLSTPKLGYNLIGDLKSCPVNPAKLIQTQRRAALLYGLRQKVREVVDGTISLEMAVMRLTQLIDSPSADEVKFVRSAIVRLRGDMAQTAALREMGREQQLAQISRDLGMTPPKHGASGFTFDYPEAVSTHFDMGEIPSHVVVRMDYRDISRVHAKEQYSWNLLSDARREEISFSGAFNRGKTSVVPTSVGGSSLRSTVAHEEEHYWQQIFNVHAFEPELARVDECLPAATSKFDSWLSFNRWLALVQIRTLKTEALAIAREESLFNPEVAVPLLAKYNQLRRPLTTVEMPNLSPRQLRRLNRLREVYTRYYEDFSRELASIMQKILQLPHGHEMLALRPIMEWDAMARELGFT